MQNLTLANSWRRAEEILNSSSWFEAWTLLGIVAFVKFSSLWHSRVVIWTFIEICWAHSKYLGIRCCLWCLKGLYCIPFINWSPSKWHLILISWHIIFAAIHLSLNSMEIAVVVWSCSWIQIDLFQLMESVIILVFELGYNRNGASLRNAIQRQSDLLHWDFGFKFGILPGLADKVRYFILCNLLRSDLNNSLKLCWLPTEAKGLLWSSHSRDIIGLLFAWLLESLQISIIWLLKALCSMNFSSF